MPSEDSKAVKKDEYEDEEDEKFLGAILANRKKKPKSATPKSHSPKDTKVKKNVKKEEADNDFEVPTAKKSSNKTDNKTQKMKKRKEEEKKKGAKKQEQNDKKREKKVYDLPGQKRDPPEERDPLRIFYESLYKQVPNSEMAAFWLMDYGLLSKEVAKKVYEKKLKKTQQHKLSSPMKTVVNVKKSTQSVTVKRKTVTTSVSTQKKKTPDSKVASNQPKKRKVEDDMFDDGSDDDFVLSSRKTKKQRAA